MDRPGVLKIPIRRQTLTDLKYWRESRKSSTFKARLIPTPNLSIPQISSKTLNKRLMVLYPEYAEQIKQHQKKQKQENTYREYFQNKQALRMPEKNPESVLDRLRLSQGLSSSFVIKQRKKDSMKDGTPTRPMHKSTKILLSTINVKTYGRLFENE